MNDESPNGPSADGSITGSQFALRAIGVIGAIVVAAATFRNCGQSAQTGTNQAQPAEKEQRGDYLSTAFRARERATKKVNEANDIRKTQKREEEEFDKKSTPKP